MTNMRNFMLPIFQNYKSELALSGRAAIWCISLLTPFTLLGYDCLRNYTIRADTSTVESIDYDVVGSQGPRSDEFRDINSILQSEVEEC